MLSMTNRPGWVFYTSILLLAFFVAAGILLPDQLAIWANTGLEFTTVHFGWLYLFATTGFLVFCIAVAASDYGHIRLGADGEAPEFPYLTWLGMIFSSGMGVGLVFWAVAEPMSHFIAPPFGGAEPESPNAASLAMRYSLFHWGFHQWANFAVVGLAIAYVRFRR
jgi:glycine betaine transporter